MERKMKFNIASTMLAIEVALILAIWLLAFIWDPQNPLTLMANLSTFLLLVFAMISMSSIFWGYEKNGTRALALGVGILGFTTLLATINSFPVAGGA